MLGLTRCCVALFAASATFAMPGVVALAAPGGGGGVGGGGADNGTITAQVNWWSDDAEIGPSGACDWLLVNGGVAVDEIGAVNWPREVEGVVLNLWRRNCPDGESWFELPVIDPTTELLPLLLTRLEQEELPKPTPTFSVLDPEFGWAYVRTPIDFRVGGTTWAPVSVTASIGPYWARVTATPGTLTFDPGESAGVGPVSCGGTGPVAAYFVEEPGACSYAYVNASSTSSYDGYHFLTTFTIDWQIAWVSSSGAGGPLDPYSTSATVELAVAEAKGIVTCTGALPEQGGC